MVGNVVTAARSTQPFVGLNLLLHTSLIMKSLVCLLTTFVSIHVLAPFDGICDETATRKVVVTETIELMRGRDTNAFSAYSTVRKKWDTHRFPRYLTVRPWTLGEFGERASNAVIAFELADGPIEQLIALDSKGRFRSFKLDAPIRREMRPVLNGESVIYYIADGVVYAFSGRTGTWDTLQAPHLPDVQWKDGTGSPPGIAEHGFDTESTDGIVVALPQGTATFSPDRGFWKIELNSQP